MGAAALPVIGGGLALGVAFGPAAFAAYRAAGAAYSLPVAAGTGAVASGATYTGGALFGAYMDSRTNPDQDFSSSFSERFAYSGLAVAMVVGGATGMYNTSMFQWAGVPNAFGNAFGAPGVLIRINSIILSQIAGRAAQAAAK